MSNLQLTRQPVATAEMLIRRPVAEVYEAFVDPNVTTQFWFTKSSGRLEPGKEVEWTWEMYEFSIPINVRSIEPNKRILIVWPGEHGSTAVEWLFDDRGDGTTFVSITNTGFGGEGDERVTQAVQSTEGFALVLAGLKAYLEHGVKLNLVGDRFPTSFEN